MVRDRRLPPALSKVDESGVPRRALLVAAVITSAAAVWAASRPDGLDRLVSVVDIGALTALALLHVSVVAWLGVRGRGGPVNVWAHAVAPVLGLAVTIAVMIAVMIAVTIAVIVEAAHTAQWVGLVWRVAGLIVLAAQHSGRRARSA